MDTITSLNASEEDYTNLTISVLHSNTRELLSCMLNIKRILPSPEKLPRDFRGLCTLFNYTTPLAYNEPDPFGKIFKFCEAKTTIKHFIQFLERIDRYDVVEDTKEFIASDIVSYKNRQYSVASSISPITCNDFDINIITFDDIYAINNGLPLPSYDAFLLFDDADIEIACSVVDKLEKENLKLCLRNRDIRPGIQFDTKFIPKLISERCNWLIAIVSNDFLKTTLNRFVMDYTQWFTVDQQVPKIIPCVFGDCVLPQELKCYVHLYFNNNNKFCDPWNKLKLTLSQNNNKSLTDSEKSDVSYQKLELEEQENRVIIEEMPDAIVLIPDTVVELPVEPPKRKNVLDRLMKTVGKMSINVVTLNRNKKKVKCESH